MDRLTDHDAHLNLVSKGDLWQIRSVIAEADRFLKDYGLSPEWIGDFNLVLAEAMTNIVRHGGLDPGSDISVSLSLRDGYLNCVLVDTGVSFDPTTLGHTQPEPDQLREGGYGWFIIRNLSKRLQYSHENGRNSLSFALPLEGFRDRLG